MAHTAHPLVSIGIPVFNGEEHLEESLKSALSQTYKNLEIIISDDSSTDTSKVIIRRYAASDKRIKVFTQEKTIGSIPNFNFVLSKATGEYFSWFAQDDIHEPQFIEKLLNTMKKDISITTAMCDYRNFTKTKKYTTYAVPSFTCASPYEAVSYFLQSTNLSFFYGLHRTDILKSIGGYHQDFRPYFKSSDFLMIMRLLLQGKTTFIGDVLFLKRDSGLFTERFENLRALPFEKLRKHIVRYLLFPIHYTFDLVGGSYFIMRSSLSYPERLILIAKLIQTTLRQCVQFLSDMVKGLYILISRRLYQPMKSSVEKS